MSTDIKLKDMKKILLVMLLAVAACWPAMAQNTVPAKNVVEVTDTVAHNYQELSGKIGPYAVKMFLDISGAEDDTEVGYYYYTAYPKTHYKLVLKKMVAVNAQGSMDMVLYEYTKAGVHSGTFDGQYECRGDHYSGTFTNSKGKRFKFTLE